MGISERTKHILDGIDSRIPDHPLKATVKASIVAAHATVDALAAKKAELQRSETLTSRGRQQALQDSLGKYGRDLARAAAPIAKMRKDVEARRGALVFKIADPTNEVAAGDRREIRAWLRSLDINARQAMLATTSDRRILEAAIAAPPELSGLSGNLASLAESVETRCLEMIHGPEIAAIKSDEAVIEEGEAGLGVARVLFQGTTELNDRDFAAVMAPVERGAGRPWLLKGTKIDGTEYVQVIEVAADGKSATYRPASESDLANGVFYKSNEEFFAANGAVAA
jgi:hypothetical protein